MRWDTTYTRIGVAAAVGTNLLLAVAAGLFVMSRPVSLQSVLSDLPTEAAVVEEVLVDTAAQAVPAEAPVTTVATPTTVAPSTVPTTVARATTTQAPTTTAPSVTPAGPTGPAPITATPDVSPGRTTPNPIALLQVMQELDRRTNFFTPTENQVNQFSTQVCDAFDQGYSFAQVKAGVLDTARQAPFLGIDGGDADWAIRQAVTLYCPGHAGKLA
jgi:hypothetical protein